MADRPHPSSNTSGPFDGTTFSYIPGPTLAIDPSLSLHREWTDKIDPITYEVIRHNLWNINEELGMTLQRISGSPVAMYAVCSEQDSGNFAKQAAPDGQSRYTPLTLRRPHGPGYRH